MGYAFAMRWRGAVLATFVAGGVAHACSSFSDDVRQDSDGGASDSGPGVPDSGRGDAEDANVDGTAPGCPSIVPTTGDGGLVTTEVSCGAAKYNLSSNRDHCGSCDRKCAGECVQGSCVAENLLSLPGGSRILFGEGDVIWLARRDDPNAPYPDTILRFDLATRTTSVFSSPDAGYIGSLAHGPTYSFAAVGGLGITLLPRDGGSPIASLTPGYVVPASMVTLGEAVFYVDAPEIRKTTADGGFTTFSNVGPDLDTMVRDERFIVASRSAGAGTDAGELLRWEIDGGEVRRFPVGHSVVTTSDAAYTYLYDANAQSILRLAKNAPDGARPEVIATWTAPTGAFVDAIALDGDDVFVQVRAGIFFYSGHILRVPRCGGPIVPVVRADGVSTVLGSSRIHVRGPWLYYIQPTPTFSESPLVRVPR